MRLRRWIVLFALTNSWFVFSNEATDCNLILETVHSKCISLNSPHFPNSAWKTDLTFLWMKAYEDGLEYADQTSGSFGATIVGSAKVLNPPFEWAPGCKAQIGYQFGENDFWDLTLSWTYFHTHTAKSHSSSDLVVADFPPLWDSFFLGSSASFASVNWMLNLNSVDLKLGKDFFLSNSFAIHPYVGVLSSWINQNYKSKYQGIFNYTDAIDDQFSISQPTSFTASNKFWGVGPLTGCDLFFHFSQKWGLFGRLSGALLYSQFDVDEKTVGGRILFDGVADVIFIPAKIDHINSFHTTRLFANSSVGFFYEKILNCTQRFGVQAGYDCAFFLDQNQFFDSVLTNEGINIGGGFMPNNSFLNHINRQGHLSLVGFSFKLLFDF